MGPLKSSLRQGTLICSIVNETINESYFAWRREVSNCTILTVSPPIYGSQVIFVGAIFPMKEIDERINEIILHGRKK